MKEFSTQELVRTKTLSCECKGNVRGDIANRRTYAVGDRFGTFTLIEKTDKRDSSWHTVWLCQCDCGRFREFSTMDLGRSEVLPCACKARRGTDDSLCWTCIRSAAPKSLQCEWVRSKANNLTEGAVTDKPLFDDATGKRNIVKVFYCPEYLDEDIEENALLLANERKKAMEQLRRDVYNT